MRPWALDVLERLQRPAAGDPAGTDGAYQLLANPISLPKAPALPAARPRIAGE